jgi:Homeodomain-like domain
MPPPASELRRLVDQGWGVDDIRAHYGRSRSTLYRWFDELEVEPPPRSSWALTISRERLAELYEQLGTMDGIAEHEGVTRGQVERAMQYHRLDRRRPSAWAQPAMQRPPVDELRRVYQEKQSVRRFADHYGVGVRKAHQWLSEAGVQRQPPGRPRTQAAKWNDR